MQSFDKSKRLLTKQEYDHVFSQAQKISIPYFIVLFRSNTVGHARLGMALSKRMIAKAHDRNRIKRMVRESFRKMVTLSSVDIIILAKPGIAKVENTILKDKLLQAWNKL